MVLEYSSRLTKMMACTLLVILEGVEPRTWGATKVATTTRLQARSLYRMQVSIMPCCSVSDLLQGILLLLLEECRVIHSRDRRVVWAGENFTSESIGILL